MTFYLMLRQWIGQGEAINGFMIANLNPNCWALWIYMSSAYNINRILDY
jgi:hypothetical protein